MKVGIIDDEIHCIESLVMCLQELHLGIDIIFKASRVDDGLDLIKRTQIDLLFLDVEMPRLNGFELLDQLEKVNFEIIFTTAYSQYALKAFKYKAFDYLMKPISQDDLKISVEKFLLKRHRPSHGEEPDMAHFIELLKKDKIISAKIAVPVSEGLEFVKVNDIIYAQSQNNYSILVLNNGEQLLFSKTLKDVESTLKKHYFIRIHQSFLINPNYMKKYFRNDGGSILMENGQTLPISQSKKENIASVFNAIAKNKTL